MKKLILAVAAAALVIMPAAAQREQPARSTPPSLRALADDVSEASLRAIVERLVSFGTRHTLSSRDHPTRGIGAALSWTESEFRRFSEACGGCLEVIRTGDTVTGRRIPEPALVDIDCHVHLNRYGNGEAADLPARHAQLRDEMDRHGVDYALVLSSYIGNDDRPDTLQILEAVEADPRIGVVAAVSYLNYRAADLADLRSLLREGRIKGLKLYPGYEPFYVHDPRMRVVYELAGEFAVPVMIHTGDTYDPKGKVKYSHPLEVDEVAVDFRDVTFVICHLGNPWITDAMEVIYKNPNVVGDISGFTLGHFEERFERFMLQQVNEVVAFAGDPSKLLYGTDWPIADMGSYIRFVNNLQLTPEENDKIFWRNAARLFRIELPEPRADEAQTTR